MCGGSGLSSAGRPRPGLRQPPGPVVRLRPPQPPGSAGAAPWTPLRSSPVPVGAPCVGPGLGSASPGRSDLAIPGCGRRGSHLPAGSGGAGGCWSADERDAGGGHVAGSLAGSTAPLPGSARDARTDLHRCRHPEDCVLSVTWPSPSAEAGAGGCPVSPLPLCAVGQRHQLVGLLVTEQAPAGTHLHPRASHQAGTTDTNESLKV